MRLLLSSLVLYALVLAGVFADGGALRASAQAPQPAPTPPAVQAAAWTAADCQTCHEKAAGAVFQHTSHAGLEQSCESCHDDVAAHMKSQMDGVEGPIPSLKNKPATEINDTCLTCHENANQASFLSSMHARRNVACTSCHSIHDFKSTKAQLKTRNDADTCFTCHAAQRAKSMRTSHHPVREGKIACSSCHNPHDGVRPKMIKADSVNELCYTCHTEKRGPFLFDHAPVREDCVSCHEPHGSNHARMLVQKAPNLCWNCHLTGSGHFGSGDRFSTEQGVPVAPPGAPSGFPTVNSRFIERSCRTCHVKIHGSNHPSGAYFVR
jgi:DmsE family decaheme c-type cytochrome